MLVGRGLSFFLLGKNKKQQQRIVGAAHILMISGSLALADQCRVGSFGEWACIYFMSAFTNFNLDIMFFLCLFCLGVHG